MKQRHSWEAMCTPLRTRPSQAPPISRPERLPPGIPSSRGLSSPSFSYSAGHPAFPSHLQKLSWKEAVALGVGQEAKPPAQGPDRGQCYPPSPLKPVGVGGMENKVNADVREPSLLLPWTGWRSLPSGSVSCEEF